MSDGDGCNHETVTDDPFTGAFTSEAQLRELYEMPSPIAAKKVIDRFDEGCRQLVALSPMVFVSSHAADGRCDVTPRGGQPGFVTILDDGHLAIPDATGNKRLDTLRNVVETGQAGLIFVIPGRAWTLRVNGRACITASPNVLDRLAPVGKPPRTAIVVAADEVFTHCPKAFIRSSFWDPATWPAADAQPAPAEVITAHLADPALPLADVEQMLEDSLKHRLA